MLHPLITQGGATRLRRSALPWADLWLPLWGENLWITIRGAVRGHSVILDFVIAPRSKSEWNKIRHLGKHQFQPKSIRLNTPGQDSLFANSSKENQRGQDSLFTNSSKNRTCGRPRGRSVKENQRGQDSLFTNSSKNRTCGRPRGRSVDAKPSRWAVDSTQEGSPSGRPGWADRRTAANSCSVSGSVSHRTGGRDPPQEPAQLASAVRPQDQVPVIRQQLIAKTLDVVALQAFPPRCARTLRNRLPCGRLGRASSLDSGPGTARLFHRLVVVVAGGELNKSQNTNP